MIKYEVLPTTDLVSEKISLPSQHLPELVHLTDPAFQVMIDFNQESPNTISPDASIEYAFTEMKQKDVHILLVADKEHHVIGLVSSEDILGEKPIKLIQQRRIERSQVLIKMVMTPLSQIPAFDVADIEHSRVGNIVKTLQTLHAHYAFVIKTEYNEHQVAAGLFNLAQISKQLHVEINGIRSAETVSELQKRHK
jgi:hypothetical protein